MVGWCLAPYFGGLLRAGQGSQESRDSAPLTGFRGAIQSRRPTFSEENAGRHKWGPWAEGLCALSGSEGHSQTFGKVAHGARVLVPVPGLEVPSLANLAADRRVDRDVGHAQVACKATESIHLTHLRVVAAEAPAEADVALGSARIGYEALVRRNDEERKLPHWHLCCHQDQVLVL